MLMLNDADNIFFISAILGGVAYAKLLSSTWKYLDGTNPIFKISDPLALLIFGFCLHGMSLFCLTSLAAFRPDLFACNNPAAWLIVMVNFGVSMRYGQNIRVMVYERRHKAVVNRNK